MVPLVNVEKASNGEPKISAVRVDRPEPPVICTANCAILTVPIANPGPEVNAGGTPNDVPRIFATSTPVPMDAGASSNKSQLLSTSVAVGAPKTAFPIDLRILPPPEKKTFVSQNGIRRCLGD